MESSPLWTQFHLLGGVSGQKNGFVSQLGFSQKAVLHWECLRGM